eukprot:CAMPEP_0168418314 /NCGR_PEP_ID=MMETSP0228-20121227/31703_1 /TAXON_ID=133427 /ORGANISM="Protoceratium reticulatum, Strain CCCM 535 (=CCMP 1889)" /LENGTH=243 /DNA_ID=CAMNT_0008432189 /DNA_START=192 /DNA_END=919 /DNA_ORIENTATION=+
MEVPLRGPQRVRGWCRPNHLLAPHRRPARGARRQALRGRLGVQRQCAHAPEEKPAVDVHAGMVVQRQAGAPAQQEDADGHLWPGVHLLVADARPAAHARGVGGADPQVLCPQLVEARAETRKEERGQLLGLRDRLRRSARRKLMRAAAAAPAPVSAPRPAAVPLLKRRAVPPPAPQGKPHKACACRLIAGLRATTPNSGCVALTPRLLRARAMAAAAPVAAVPAVARESRSVGARLGRAISDG